VVSAGIVAGVPGWPLLLPVQGVLLVFLFTLEHECTHRTPFATPWLNEAVGFLAGLVILQPFQWFRAFHLAHHRFTNDPERDPELLSGAKPGTWRAYLLHLSGIPVWRGLLAQLWVNAFGDARAPWIAGRALPRLRREARVMLALYALALASLAVSPLLLWLWIVPLLLGQPVLRLYLLAEHARCPTIANMLANTRTTFTNRLVRALAWNMPYHIEHHSAPWVPFHALPDLHERMRPHLVTTAPGYAAFTREYSAGLQGE
jgi:fatty acid desaturase